MKTLMTALCAIALMSGCADGDSTTSDYGMELVTTAPASGKADSANAQSCHWRCDNPCPPGAYCIAVCYLEEYGNCSMDTCGGEYQLCKEGYVFNPAKCECQPTGPKDACFYDGKWRKAGTSFKDDCNTCWCGDNGQVACTKIACADPTPSCNSANRSYVSTDPEQCAAIFFVCAEGEEYFFDPDCGCGCTK